MQSPSFLGYQRSLEQAHGENNARTLFVIHQILSDNHTRSLLDVTPPSAVEPMYAYFFNALEQAGVVDAQRSAARGCSPWTGPSISPRRASTVNTVRHAATPTAR